MSDILIKLNHFTSLNEIRNIFFNVEFAKRNELRRNCKCFYFDRK